MRLSCDEWLYSVLRPPDRRTRQDIDLLLWSFRLEKIRRYVGQPFWDEETLNARYADRIEGHPRLETVAEHSWQLADAVLLLGPRFPYLDLSRAVKMAILHDKMEIQIGDWNPLGRDGTGDRGHAFNDARAEVKNESERAAIDLYLSRLRPEDVAAQRSLLLEALECESPESRFLKALDKMSALAFIYLKKEGRLEDRHVRFLLRYTYENNRLFPPLVEYSDELLRRNLVAWMRSAHAGREKLLSLVDRQETLDLSDFEATIAASQHSKRERLDRLFQELNGLPLAKTGIEAQCQIANCLNRIEDETHPGVWAPPRHYPPGSRTERLYPVGPDSIYPVEGWLVSVLVSVGELVYISAGGAVEVRLKERSERVEKGKPRMGHVIYSRLDAQGRGVWDAGWRQSLRD